MKEYTSVRMYCECSNKMANRGVWVRIYGVKGEWKCPNCGILHVVWADSPKKIQKRKQERIRRSWWKRLIMPSIHLSHRLLPPKHCRTLGDMMRAVTSDASKHEVSTCQHASSNASCTYGKDSLE